MALQLIPFSGESLSPGRAADARFLAVLGVVPIARLETAAAGAGRQILGTTSRNSSLSTLHERGTRVSGGRKVEDTLAGSNEIKNAQGEVFKRVDFAPSRPHGGLLPHTHPNFRNVLPDGSVRSGVSRHAQPVTRKDIIDAARDGGQRTGGSQ